MSRSKDLAPSFKSKPLSEQSEALSDAEEFDSADEDADFDQDFEYSEGETEQLSNDEEQDSAESSHLPQKRTEAEKLAARHEQKRVRLERQSQKKNFDLLVDLKQLWEQARVQSLSSKERTPLIEAIFKKTRGKVAEFIFKHDASRIIQTLFKFASEEQRYSVAAELKGKFYLLAQGKYSKHLVVKVVKCCPKIRSEIFAEFRGHVRRLMRHKNGSHVLEVLYVSFANATQKRVLIEEFYGNEAKLFLTNKKSLAEMLEMFPEKRRSIMSNMIQTISGVLDKGGVGNSILHQAMFEFISFVQDKSQLDEFFGLIREQLPEILHTQHGHRVVSHCIAHSNVKERKAILKALKPFMSKIIKEEYGHMVLLTCIYLVDDVVLLEKCIFSELLANFTEYFQDKYGRLVILFCLAGPNPKYFSVDVGKLLKSLLEQSTAAEFSKKPFAQKKAEMFAMFSEKAFNCINSKFEESIKDYTLSGLVLEISADKKYADLFVQKCEVLLSADPAAASGHILHNVNASFALKKLASTVAGAPVVFWNSLKPSFRHWAFSTDGSFLILTLLNAPETHADVKSALSPLSKELSKVVAKDTSMKGQKFLLEQLAK